MGWSGCGARNWTRNRSPLSEILIVAVGKLSRGPEAELFQRYNDRLRPKISVIEIAEARGSPAEIKRREATGLLAATPAACWAVALDLGGRAPGSEGLASLLTQWQDLGKKLCFLIGGAEGLDGTVLARADYVLSLGPLTWPHFLVRVLLAEQIFRARSIASGHPYHRAGRP